MQDDNVRPPSGPDPLRNLKFLLNLPNFIKLYWRLFNDKRVSLLPKIVLVAGLLYWLVPLDLIPWVPQIGWIDDTVAVALAVYGFIKLCPRKIVQEHVEIIDQGG